MILGLACGVFAQGGGLFQYGGGDYFYGTDWAILSRATNEPLLPNHGQTTNQPAPLGGGALLLIGFGAAYAAAKRRKE